MTRLTKTHSESTPFSSMRLVQSPRSLQTLARLLGGALLFTLVGLVAAPWQQNVPGTGRVAAYAPYERVQTLAAPVDGRIRQVWVLEGSRVETGDRILELVDNDPSILERLETQREALEMQLDSAQERVAVFEKQIAALENARRLGVEAAESQVQVAEATTRAAGHALEGARAVAEQAELNYRRQKDLVDEGLVSELDYELAERAFREATARVAQADQALQAARNDERASRAQLGKVDTEAQAGIESAKGGRESASVSVAALRERVAALASRIAKQSTQLITAPRAGTVYRLFAAPGAELVKAGDPLVSLIPDAGGRAVELWVDGNHIPLIDEGRPVRLQFEGWPAVQFAGWPSVAVGTFGGRVALVDPTDDGYGRFRLLVVPDETDAPWPAPRFLRQGVRANGFVLLDEVSLGYELWRQANGFPPTVAMQPGTGGRGEPAKDGRS